MIRNFILKLKNKPTGPIYFSYKKDIFTLLNIFKNYGFLDFEINFINNSKNQYKVNILKNNMKSIWLISNSTPISYKKLDTQLYSYILSTPKGLLYHEDAIKFKVGGFIICKFI